MSDEGFHEIQLNGKQLVFLFMAGTVVAVVIFLCGVMVGRGVQIPRSATVAAASPDSLADPTTRILDEPVAATSSTESVPLTAQETLTYAERLESLTPPVESLKPVVESAPAPVPEPVTTAPVAAQAGTPQAAAAPAAESFPEPAGNGWVVQVAAVQKRTEAESIARRLAGKGYPTFIASNGAGSLRVRVGKYTDRREAETVAARLEKDEQFKPWLTR
jgi:cell division septation protein DedD